MSVAKVKIRLFVIKEEEGFEVLSHEVFCNELYTYTPKIIDKSGKQLFLGPMETDNFRLNDVQWVQEDIDCIGWDGIAEGIERILEPYKPEDVVEILGDYNIRGFWSGGWEYPEEWDQDSWLDNEQHNKLRDVEIERYVGAFKRDNDGRIVFENEQASFNHGEQEE